MQYTVFTESHVNVIYNYKAVFTALAYVKEITA